MKLLAIKNDTHLVFSVSRHDYRSVGEGSSYIMMDGGQPYYHGYAGYNRFSGNDKVIIDIRNIDLADLYNDYAFNRGPRLYGVHEIKDLDFAIVDEENDPFFVHKWWNSFEFKRDNAIWLTRGNEDNPGKKYIMLKDASTDHLENILKLVKERNNVEYTSYVASILDLRKKYS